MIPRGLAPTLTRSAEWYPVVTVTGPRQAGRTTLVRNLFDLPYLQVYGGDRRHRRRGVEVLPWTDAAEAAGPPGASD